LIPQARKHALAGFDSDVRGDEHFLDLLEQRLIDGRTSAK
jgi:hypothetical protein